MIKKICSNCEKKFSEIKKDKHWEVPAFYHIEIVMKNVKNNEEVLEREVYALCPTCFKNTGLKT